MCFERYEALSSGKTNNNNNYADDNNADDNKNQKFARSKLLGPDNFWNQIFLDSNLFEPLFFCKFIGYFNAVDMVCQSADITIRDNLQLEKGSSSMD